MKSFKKALWGVLLVAAGILLALNAFEVISFHLFFPGWWTLFIIVPCLSGLIFERDKAGNFFGLTVGVILLLWKQGVLPLQIFGKLILPILIVGVGLEMIFGGLFRKKNKEPKTVKGGNKRNKKGFALFSGCDVKMDGEVFEGGQMVAVFGGVECDLRNAIIEQDCVIHAVAVFGGVDILVPDHVNVKCDSFSLFGGADDLTAKKNTDGVTVYVKTVALFGGAEIR